LPKARETEGKSRRLIWTKITPAPMEAAAAGTVAAAVAAAGAGKAKHEKAHSGIGGVGCIWR
jgi:hypothetical protein